jgi:mRNA interferase MazF
MQKDFDQWNQRKKLVDDSQSELYFYEMDVWWVSLGVNVGFEQDGKNEEFTRPVLVLKKFSKNVFVAIPLSTSKKKGRYYFTFDFCGGESIALLSQIRLLDSKRLVSRMGKISESIFQDIRKAVKDIL